MNCQPQHTAQTQSSFRGRLVSPFERIGWRLHKAVSSNFTIICRVRGSLSEAALQAALDDSCIRFPLLRVRIEDSPNGLWIQPDDVPPIPIRVVEAEMNELATIVAGEIDDPVVAETGPMVRCVLIRHEGELQHILLTSHHMMSDGMSSVTLMEYVLCRTSQYQTGPSPSNEEALISDTRPIDERLVAKKSGLRRFWKAVRFAVQTHRQDRRFGKVDMIRADAEGTLADRRTRLIMREFDEEFVTQLVEKARANDTTVHGAISAAVCLGIASEHGGDESLSIRHRIPVNMRDRFDTPAQKEIGLFMSMSIFRDRINSNDSFWQVAQNVRRQIAAQIDKDTPTLLVSMIPRIYRMLGGDRLDDDQFANHWRRRMPTTTGATNLGRVNLDVRSELFDVESFQIAGCPGVIGDFSTYVVTFRGRLYVSFYCPEPIFQQERAIALVDDIVRRLRDACA